MPRPERLIGDRFSRAGYPADVYEAAQLVCREYREPGASLAGVPLVAAKMGLPAGTLYNKLNPHESSHHKLTVQDLIQATVITRDLRVLKALAQTLGCACFELPNLAHVPDQALLELLTKVGAEQGEFFRAIHDGLADRRFTRREYTRVRREGFEAIAAIVEATARIEGLIDD